jgi:hypothetical protein
MQNLVSVNVKIDALISKNDLLRNKIVDLEQRLGISRNLHLCSSKDVKAVKPV